MSERVKANFVDHISIAVKDVARAEEAFKKALGWEVSGHYIDSGEKIRVSYFMVGPRQLKSWRTSTERERSRSLSPNAGRVSWCSPSTWTTAPRSQDPGGQRGRPDRP